MRRGIEGGVNTDVLMRDSTTYMRCLNSARFICLAPNIDSVAHEWPVEMIYI